jgi:nicotinamidase-related amidase
MTATELRRPEPQSITLDPATSAIAVLDLSVRCNDPKQICHELMERLGVFLERARGASVPIIFTASLQDKGTPNGEIATALKRRESEPVLYPDAFDKFYGGEFKQALDANNVKNLVIVGSSTHVAVMYTATAAARVFQYEVVIPVDGVNTQNAIEHTYALHQLTAIPARAASHIRFSELAKIDFR